MLYPDHLVVECVGPQGSVELAMSRESLTGFQSWLEVAAARDGLVALTASPVLAARNAVVLAFVLNGFLFASLVSRIPDLREGLSLDNSGLGVAAALDRGRVDPGPALGGQAHPPGAPARWCGRAASAAALGLLVAGVGAGPLGVVPVCAVGLFAFGIGSGVWDVAMNVEGAEVERGLGRSIMPRFHAAWSIGGDHRRRDRRTDGRGRRAVAGALRARRWPRRRALLRADPLLPAG